MLNLHLCSKPALEVISKLDEIVLSAPEYLGTDLEQQHYWAVKYAGALRHFVGGGLRQAMYSVRRWCRPLLGGSHDTI
jgi:hypothetical protein